MKALPIRVDYKEDGNRLLVKITGEGTIQDFKINEYRGLQNLKVVSGDKWETRDLNLGEELELEIVFEKPDGLSYLAVDVEGKVNQLSKKQSLTVPVGKLTKEQKAARRQNIRTEDEGEALNSGSNSSTTPKKRDVHILRVE